MLEKIETGKVYLADDDETYIVPFCIDRGTVFYWWCTNLQEVKTSFNCKTGSMKVEDFKRQNKEMPKQKKRFWLWDVKLSGGYVFKGTVYLDEQGCSTTGHLVYPKETLLKKHENEFIDVEVNNEQL